MAWGKTVAVVTGASRGIGAAVCEQLAERLGPGSVVVAVARDGAGLRQLALRVAAGGRQVELVPLEQDLSRPVAAELTNAIAEAFERAQRAEGGRVATAVVVHNAGSLGPLRPVAQLDDMAVASQYYDLNLSSVYVVNAAFLRQATALQRDGPDLAIKVVNITSLAALEPFKSWALYCSGKAARDALFRVLAAEEPLVRVLSYAPGPVDTAMLHTAAAETPDAALRDSIRQSLEEKTALTPQQTVSKLLRLLEEDAFTSGDHVDYYDV